LVSDPRRSKYRRYASRAAQRSRLVGVPLPRDHYRRVVPPIGQLRGRAGIQRNGRCQRHLGRAPQRSLGAAILATFSNRDGRLHRRRTGGSEGNGQSGDAVARLPLFLLGSTAQRIPAVLLANATATTFAGPPK